MITTNYADRGTPRFRVLTDEQCREITLATFECLERIGVSMGNAEARDLLARAGAEVDGERVRIPANLVRDAIASTPPSFTVWGRDPERAMHVAPDRVHFGPGLTSTYFIDPESGERRPARRGDPASVARVADALPNIDYVMGLGLIGDVQADQVAVYEFAELLTNTTKPIVAWAHRVENVEAMYRMGVAAAGGAEEFRRKPSFAFFSTFPSPLRATHEDLANVMWAAAHHIPVIYIGGPIVGIEAPFSAASALVIYQAGALAGLTAIQLKRRGAAVAIGTVPSPMDLRTARPSYGGPEMSLNSAAAVDLARYLGLPFMGTAGASESKLVDAQAGAEAAVQVLMSALSGAALVHDAGFLDCADIASLPMLVLTDEIIGMAKRIMRGLEVNRETIMLDLIEQVGPGKHFLEEQRSAQLSRKEVWMPTIFDRSQHIIWEQGGCKDTSQRIQDKLRRILRTHRPVPLAPEVETQVTAILAEIEARA